MTEKTTKPTNRGRAKTPKKVTEKAPETLEEVKEATPVVKQEPKEEVKPQRQRRKEIDRNELIACRSTTTGRLIYISPRSKEKFIWDDFGHIEHLEMGELITMKSAHPKFLTNVQLVVDDEEAAEYLGLNKIYDDMLHVEELDDIFEKTNDELLEILPKLPAGLKKAVGNRARTLIEEGAASLDSRSKVKLIGQELGIDLQLFMD